jgi:hypothetical protein
MIKIEVLLKKIFFYPEYCTPSAWAILNCLNISALGNFIPISLGKNSGAHNYYLRSWSQIYPWNVLKGW